MTRAATVALVLATCFASGGLAQFEARPQLSPNVTVDEIDQGTLSQLQRADKFFAESQFADGVETLRRAIDQPGQRLVPTTAKSAPKGFVTYLPLREEGQRRLGAMPAEALKLYRSQVDGEAKTLLDEAKKQRNAAGLERIVQNYLASTSGDEAALLLGDARLAAGDVTAARAAWLKLHPSLRTSDEAADQLGVYPGLPWYFVFRGRPLPLDDDKLRPLLTAAEGTALLPAHPEAKVPLAAVRARLVVASILAGDPARAEWELKLFRELHAGEQGSLAGKTGEYVELLQQMLNQSRDWPEAKPTNDWPTFAGSDARNTIPGPLDVAGTQLWSVELPRIKSDRDLIGAGRLRVAEHHDGVLSYHPIVYQNLAIVSDGLTLRAFDPVTGKLAWEVPLRTASSLELLTNQQAGVPRFTLSAVDNLVAATLPTPTIPGRRAAAIRRDELSRIVAVDLTTRKLIFEAVADDASMIFEGTPILDRGCAYVIVRKQAEIIPQMLVACFDLGSGRRLWQQPICSAQSIGEGKRVEYGNALLTLDREMLYCNTNLGTIAALNASDGELRWITKYPRASFPSQKPERTDRHFFRDLNPCVVHHAQILCAPADCERIFSLDATSGQLIWTLPPNDAADAVHLLGASGEHLLASGDYLYWIHAVTGQVVTQFPPAVPLGPGLSLPSPRGWGRGLIAGDRVYWPTQTSLHIFASSPEQTGMFRVPKRLGEFDLHAAGASGGNLVTAGGVLLVVTADKLFAFGSEKEK